MELVKKNIHMDRTVLSAGTQLTLDDDRNVADSKPDINTLVFEQGNVKIDEVRPANEHVAVKGRLIFNVIYHTNEGEVALAGLTGEIPFEEQVIMSGVTGMDNVEAKAVLEDLNVSMINSRKINIQSVISLELMSEELYEEEAAVDIYQGEPVEYRNKQVDVTQLAIHKNDIFRLKEEVMLPANYPNIFDIIFSNVTLNDVEFKALDEKLSIQGEMHIFVIYEGEGEEQPIRTFESVIPLSGILECAGCRESMIPDIQYEVGHLEVDIKPDLDGEERVISIEMVMDILMRLYEEDRVELLTDVYGVTKEVDVKLKQAEFKQLLAGNAGKYKISEHIRLEPADNTVLQIIHSEGSVEIDDTKIVEDGIRIDGSVLVKVLYVTGEDSNPYGSIRRQIPFSYILEVTGIKEGDIYNIRPGLEQLNVTMLDSEEMDVKAVVGLKAIVFRMNMQDIVDHIEVGEINPEILNNLPGIAVYVVQPGDSLWKIGKKYYVSVDSIKAMNNLTSDEIRPGDKLLIVK